MPRGQWQRPEDDINRYLPAPTDIKAELLARPAFTKQTAYRLYLSMRLCDVPLLDAAEMIADAVHIPKSEAMKLIRDWQADTRRLNDARQDVNWYRKELTFLLERSRFRATLYDQHGECADIPTSVISLDASRKEDEFQIKLMDRLMEAKQVADTDDAEEQDGTSASELLALVVETKKDIEASVDDRLQGKLSAMQMAAYGKKQDGFR